MKPTVDIKKIIILLVIVVSIAMNIFLGLIFYQKNSAPPVLSAADYLSPDAEKYSRYIELIREYVNTQKFASVNEKIDFVRNWIYSNSIHQIDSSYNLREAFNTPKVLSLLWKTHESGAKHIQLTCGPQAVAMQKVLDQLQLKSRVVMIFSDNQEQPISHTFLEVFNPESERWETQDPDFNIFYIDKKTEERIATFRLVFGDIESFIPGSVKGYGWTLNSVDHLRQSYFEVLMYGNPLTAKNPLILVNTDRFNVNKVFSKSGGLTFRQFAASRYNSPVFLNP